MSDQETAAPEFDFESDTCFQKRFSSLAAIAVKNQPPSPDPVVAVHFYLGVLSITGMLPHHHKILDHRLAILSHSTDSSFLVRPCQEPRQG